MRFFRKKPKPKPKPKTELENLEVVLIHRTTCGVCNYVIKDLTTLGLIDEVKLVNVDTENWGIYRPPNFPSGSLSLPIIISQKTKKYSLGFIRGSELINKLK